jgi:hypothetical protein
MRTKTFCFLLLSLMVLDLDNPPADASMFMQANFDDVVQGSELIFEGRVVSKQVRPFPANGKPFTYFTFKIIDVVKGSYPHPTIEIGYMGGTIGDVRLKVSDMQMPEVGERGVYFVETLSQQQIHPLFGWQQGHYLVTTDQQTGKDIVLPVAQEKSVEGISRAVHTLTVESFKQSIRNAVGRSQ